MVSLVEVSSILDFGQTIKTEAPTLSPRKSGKSHISRHGRKQSSMGNAQDGGED